jgi:D-alanyl-D-alanine carboxypeptidase
MIRRATLALFALLALVAVPATAGAAPKKTGAQLRAALKELMSADDAPPGVAVLVQRGKRTTFLRRGKANLETGARPTKRQHYRIASMAKAFNGAVALKLIARGKLRPNDTVADVLGPDLLPQAEDVTLAQALQHTAGLPDYIHQDAFINELINNPTQYMTPLELLDFVKGVDPEFGPGERYAYSDTDNIVVGLMAEAVTGKPYEELLERHVYRPAGLKRTSLPDTVEMPKPYMHGYEIDPHDPPEDVSEFINPALAWASGGIVSNLVDVNRFFRAYVGGKLFNAKAKRVQRKWVIGSSSPPGPGRNRAGLGLFRYRTHCGTMFGHTGSFPGYRLFAAADRTGRRSVVFTVNAQIVPGMGNQEVSDLIRHAQLDAVCHALR